eukprot:11181941-Lingulodinium_polyedra.AAC.1
MTSFRPHTLAQPPGPPNGMRGASAQWSHATSPGIAARGMGGPCQFRDRTWRHDGRPHAHQPVRGKERRVTLPDRDDGHS